MTVKTGTAWAGAFVTLDATGALEAGTPSGVLYVDGVADAATVTITGSNPYKWSVTLPSLTAGQRVDMYITATISTIATAGFVASEQADTALVSEVKAETASILADTGTDGVLVSSGTGAKQISLDSGKVLLQTTQTGVTIPTVTAVTNGVTLADDAITSAKFDENTAFPVKKADALTTELARKDSASSYMADVSGLATSSALTAVDDLVDDLETRLTAVRAGYLDKLNVSGTLAHSNDADTYKADVSAITGASLSATGIDAILDEIVVGTYTMRQILKLMAAKMHGKATGGGTTSIKYTGLDNVADVIIETVDTNGNRSAVSLTV